MKYSKLMKERVRRTEVLFRELGYELTDSEMLEDSYTAGFESDDGFQGGLFIDRESKFLELAFTFAFSAHFADFIRSRLEDIVHICYEYGSYFNLETGDGEIAFSVFSKIYYAGLNYFSLKETVRDYREAIDTLEELFQIQREFGRGVSYGDT